MQSPTETLALVLRTLAADDLKDAWDRAFVLLGSLGLRRCDSEAEPAWLLVQHGQHRVRLAADQPVAPEVRELLAPALELALARSDEVEQHQRTRERLELLYHASFEGILVHVNGVVIDVNQRLAEILRAPREELLGPKTMSNHVAPEDLSGVMQRLREEYEGAYVITGVRKDGTRFRAELLSKQGRLGEQPVRIAAVRDVTERERTWTLLRESEARLQDLVDTIFDLTVLSRDGIVVEARGDLEKILGYTRAEVVGRPLLEFVAPSAVPEARKVVSEQLTGAYQSTIISAAGELVPFEIVGVNSTLDGKPTRVAGLRDLRDARRRESERRKLEQQLERAQRLNSLGVLAGGIAHDFNNLLVGILGNADLLLSTTTDPETRELLEPIVDCAQKAAGLTSQMLAYAGRGSFGEPVPIELNELFRELGTLISASLSKKATLTLELEAGSVVLGDRTTLTQVFLNLLTNASDALDGTAGTIRVRSRRLEQPDSRWDDALGSTVGAGDWIQIQVEDNGVGMDRATQARAFEPFFTTKRKGNGLGLAACLGIVSAHGGALRVESALGKGTCFWLLLPASDRAAKPSTHPVVAGASSCRVLIVDDEAIVRTQLRRSLELRGFSVLEAENGRAGLALMERGGIDLAIVDMTMDDIDGADIVREARRRAWTLPIVLTSGYVDAATERRLEPGSFQAFLRKPYGIAELLEVVRHARPGAMPTH
ncbi:MAG TPA: ATP-binding protein [Polyangiaceae bacterium]